MFGWWWSFVDLIEWCLQELTDITGSGGLAIILFTVALKTVLLPLTVKSIKSTAAMQELQPKIKELQKKYSKDRQRLSQETMRLYQEYEINPAAGCLPLLIQIPIFFGLFYAVRDLSKTAGEFLWLNSLNDPDPWKLLPILAGIFQFVQTKMMRPHNGPKVTDPQQQMMNTMMNFMPLMVVVFGWNFASGAVLYWATQSIYSVIQQWLITGWGSMKNWFPWLPDLPEHRRLAHRKKPLERKDIDVNAPPKGLMGKMQKRMLDMEEQQAQRADAARGATGTTKGGGTSGSTRSTGSSGSGKRAKQTRVAGDVRNVSGGATDDDEPPVKSDTRSTTRVMSSRQNGAGSRRSRGNGRVND